MRYGSREVAGGAASTGASAATMTNSTMMEKPAIESGLRFMRRVKSPGSDQNTPTATTSSRNAATSRDGCTTRPRTTGAAAITATRTIRATTAARRTLGDLLRATARQIA